MGTSPAQIAQLSKLFEVDSSLFQEVELSQSQVDLGGFFIDRTEVTNRAYEHFLKTTGYPQPVHWKTEQRSVAWGSYPVTGVNYEDALAYARWAGKRLPTESEWEKAARGTDGRLYPWGNSWVRDAALIADSKSHVDPFGLSPIASFPKDSSPYGVLDMAGSVAEWTSTPAENAKHWKGFQIVKGGSFVHSEPYSFRCSARAAHPPVNGSVKYIGFRCAVDASSNSVQNLALEKSSAPPKAGDPPSLPEPRLDSYLNNPIQIFPGPSGRLDLRVPYLPEEQFSLLLLESLQGVAENRRSKTQDFEFSADHLSVSHRWTEPETRQDRLQIQVEGKGQADSVDIRYYVKNIGRQTRKGDVSSCFQALYSPNFRDLEGSRTMVYSEGRFESLTNLPRSVLGRIYLRTHFIVDRHGAPNLPFVAIVSRDREWLVSQATENAASIFSNNEYSCQHSITPFVLQPGRIKVIRQKHYFLRGRPIDLMRRWQRDFGNNRHSLTLAAAQ